MKSTSYNLYRTRTNSLAKTAKIVLKDRNPKLAKLLKKQDDHQVMRYLIRGNPSYIESLDSLIITEEMLWEADGCPVIFPETPEFLDKLLTAKFDLNQTGGFSLPFANFMLPMPKDYKCEGVNINGILVTSYRVGDLPRIFKSYADFLNEKLDPKICAEMGIDPNKKIKFSEQRDNYYKKGFTDDEQLLSICLLDNNKNILEQGTLRASEAYSKIPALLQSKTANEFNERLGYIDVNYKSQKVLSKDAVAQFYALKIICALAVYNQATDGEMLHLGMPSSRVNFSGKLGKTTNYNITFAAGTVQNEGITPNAHYRQWHFRQLRDERYYQGKHKNKPVGSRWTFVKDTLVGASKIDPHTAIEVK